MPPSQVLADHGRSTHKLAEKWRAECKKAKELGAAAPLPPYQQKRLEARKGTARGLESDSSEEERVAADMAEAEAAEQDAGAATETSADAILPGAQNAEDKMCAAPPRTHAPAPSDRPNQDAVDGNGLCVCVFALSMPQGCYPREGRAAQPALLSRSLVEAHLFKLRVSS